MKDLTNIHYYMDKNNRKKVKKEASKLGYETKHLGRGVAHFEKDGEHVVSIKGTDPFNLKDMVSDASIFLGNVGKDKQFNKRRQEVKKIYKSIPDDEKVSLIGHSLGGSIGTHMLSKSKSIRDRTHDANFYNTGYTKAFHKELRQGLTPEDRRQLNEKITHHQIHGDVVSEPLKQGSVGGVMHHKPQENSTLLERHSLDAFDL